MTRDNCIEQLHNLHVDLHESIEEVRIFNPTRKTGKAVLIAAFCKCADYAEWTTTIDATKESFISAPLLRGICEDFICLTFYTRFYPRLWNGIAKKMVEETAIKSLKAQWEFMGKIRPRQYLLPPSPDNHALPETFGLFQTVTRLPLQVESNLEKYLKKHACVIPRSTFEKASKIDERDLYEFLYHATSRLVHFDPRLLLRTGWFTSHLAETRFDFRNFAEYYYQFNLIYAHFMLHKYVQEHGERLRLTKKARHVVEKMRACIDSVDRWPEIVTPEEVNLRISGWQEALHIARRMTEGRL